MRKKMTLSEISKQINLTDKTLRKYIKNGELNASYEDLGPGQQRWLVDEEDLYACEAPTIRNALDPKKVREYDTKDDRIRQLQNELEEKDLEILDLKRKDEEREGIDDYAILKEELKKQKEETAFIKEAFTALLKAFQVAIDMHKSKKIKELLEATGLNIEFEMLDEYGAEWEITYEIADKYKTHNKYITGPDTYDGLYSYLCYNDKMNRK